MKKTYKKPVIETIEFDESMGRCCKEYRGDSSY